MPAIYIRKNTLLGLQISACVNGNKDFAYQTLTDPNFPENTGMTKGKWYLVEVGQYYDADKTDYVYYIIINGQVVKEVVNKQPYEQGSDCTGRFSSEKMRPFKDLKIVF